MTIIEPGTVTKAPHPDTLVPEPEDAPDDAHLTHIVRKDDEARGYLLKEPVTALCGYTWVPERDPQKYPMCKPCVDVFNHLQGRSSGLN